ncbi:hypothetical protein A7G45_07865 [Mycolicibacterium llatzerense]|nr:hypothetical protein [Mycolicibacterium llatzerense]
MPLKRVMWLIINRPTPESYLAANCSRQWPAASSITSRFNTLRRFGHYLGEQGITQLREVTIDLLDSYAVDLLGDQSGSSRLSIALDLGYIGAIAHLVEYLPEADRMVEPTWSSKELVHRAGERTADNSKAIIDPDTFAPLLWWAQQIVRCAPDVIAAVEWVNASTTCNPAPGKSTAGFNAVTEVVASFGGVLPQGRRDGQVAAEYLIAVRGGGIHVSDFSKWRHRRGGEYVIDPALPQPIPVPVEGVIEGRGWLPFLDYRDIRDGKMLRILRAAAAVLICSCTGMRGEECRKLPLGALRKILRPDGAQSFRIDGRIYKGIGDENGQQDTEGKPWIWATIKPGADAIEVLEGLAVVTKSDRLFSFPDTRQTSADRFTRVRIVGSGQLIRWIEELIEFANEMVIELELDPSRWRPSLQPHVRNLAVLGFCVLTLVFGYHLPFNWLGLIGTSHADLPSYLLPGQ